MRRWAWEYKPPHPSLMQVGGWDGDVAAATAVHVYTHSGRFAPGTGRLQEGVAAALALPGLLGKDGSRLASVAVAAHVTHSRVRARWLEAIKAAVAAALKEAGVPEEAVRWEAGWKERAAVPGTIGVAIVPTHTGLREGWLAAAESAPTQWALQWEHDWVWARPPGDMGAELGRLQAAMRAADVDAVRFNKRRVQPVNSDTWLRPLPAAAPVPLLLTPNRSNNPHLNRLRPRLLEALRETLTLMPHATRSYGLETQLQQGELGRALRYALLGPLGAEQQVQHTDSRRAWKAHVAPSLPPAAGTQKEDSGSGSHDCVAAGAAEGAAATVVAGTKRAAVRD